MGRQLWKQLGGHPLRRCPKLHSGHRVLDCDRELRFTLCGRKPVEWVFICEFYVSNSNILLGSGLKMKKVDTEKSTT